MAHQGDVYRVLLESEEDVVLFRLKTGFHIFGDAFVQIELEQYIINYPHYVNHELYDAVMEEINARNSCKLASSVVE